MTGPIIKSGITEDELRQTLEQELNLSPCRVTVLIDRAKKEISVYASGIYITFFNSRFNCVVGGRNEM